jgi:hypothetical protein
VSQALVITNLNPTEQINLGTIIDNGLSVQVGDKLFSDFVFTYNDTDGNPLTDLTRSNVTIIALQNDFGIGMSFTQPLIALGLVYKDITLKYSATVTDPNFAISDLHLSITGSANNGGVGSVAEDAFLGGWGATNVGHLQADTTNPPTNLTATTYFVPPVPYGTKLWIQKDVIVAGSGPSSYATISIVDQTFSQIPEPSTVLLVGVGLLGAFAVMRRRQS